VLLERDTFPRDKLCGEFLSGESRALLAELGCLAEVLTHGPSDITQVRFISTSGRKLLVPLPTPALGISRRVLDEILYRHACAAGADGRTGVEVTGISLERDMGGSVMVANTEQPVSASLIIGAYGRHSRLDRELQRPFVSQMDASIGIKRHHLAAPGTAGSQATAALAHTCEIYSLDGGYCGVSPIEDGMINVCMLLKKNAFNQLRSADWNRVTAFLSNESPALGRRLAGLMPADEPVLTVSQMPFRKIEPARPGMLFLGDAAAMIAPVVGDGMAMALESGMMLAKLILEENPKNRVSFDQFSSDWKRSWHQKFSARLRIARAIQHLAFRPHLGNAAIYAMHLGPSFLPRFLAQATRG
jgi:flavin-dependent dehydrogenase